MGVSTIDCRDMEKNIHRNTIDSTKSLSTKSNASSGRTLVCTDELVFRDDSIIANDDIHTFPEGGVQAWFVVFGAWCALFASLGIMNTMGAFQEYISNHQLNGYDVGTVGWIFSLYAFLTFGVSLFVGPIFDAYGPRWLIASGSFLVTTSMALIAICSGESSQSLGELQADPPRILAFHTMLQHRRRSRICPPLLPLHRHRRPLL